MRLKHGTAPSMLLLAVITALKREQGLVEVWQTKFVTGARPAKRSKNQANKSFEAAGWKLSVAS